MRVLFAGTPEIAVPALDAVHREHTVCGVLTTPDKAVGRGRNVSLSPVKERALALGLPLLQPHTLDRAARERIRELAPEILVVVAYGKIFGPKFLALFPRGGINLHPSLLPKYRGPSPIPAVILNGERETGITVQQLSLKMDAGDIITQMRIPLDGSETTASLTRQAAYEGAELVAGALRQIENGSAQPVPQREEEATYCSLITKEDGSVEWSSSAVRIERMIRAYDPWPKVHTTFRGTGLTLLEGSVFHGDTAAVEQKDSIPPGFVLGIDKEAGILVKTGEGVIAFRKLQLQAKKPLEWKAFLNGVRDFTGTVLGGG